MLYAFETEFELDSLGFSAVQYKFENEHTICISSQYQFAKYSL